MDPFVKSSLAGIGFVFPAPASGDIKSKRNKAERAAATKGAALCRMVLAVFNI
jgi:hypothetical protein